MARKRLRKPTKINVTVEAPRSDEGTTGWTPPKREPEHTATFWRNTYELERSTREATRREIERLREENTHLKEEIERLPKQMTSIDDESRVVSRPVRKRVRASHRPPTT